MAEGGRFNSAGCASRCNSLCRGWVPQPQRAIIYTRRDPYIDAVGRMDNPCERPSRCPPCCIAVPKFRLPKEQPVCNINCYRQEQVEAKMRECWDPKVFQQAPENTWFLKDKPCSPYTISGIVNDLYDPYDMRTAEQLVDDAFDPPPYPCRGVINYPRQVWANLGEAQQKRGEAAQKSSFPMKQQECGTCYSEFNGPSTIYL